MNYEFFGYCEPKQLTETKDLIWLTVSKIHFMVAWPHEPQQNNMVITKWSRRASLPYYKEAASPRTEARHPLEAAPSILHPTAILTY